MSSITKCSPSQLIYKPERGTTNTTFKKSVTVTVTPDSTTTPEEMLAFCIGEDVLLKQKDGCFYFGTIVQVNSLKEQCLVKFGDNTDNWSNFKDITKLSTPQSQEDLLCVVCKKSAPKNRNEITVCDKCGRGYHRKCHHPEIASKNHKEAEWKCSRCVTNETHNYSRQQRSDSKLNNYYKRASYARSSSGDSQIEPTSTASNTKVLSYDINSLTWDTEHKINTDHVYCYCGSSGEWYQQMLQCNRCKQWFHERCLDCLMYPLYYGDRFYLFVCSICNHGKEFLRRLEMQWLDLVHLMLFNLTAYNSKKYYDLDTIVIPYINDNWHALQLPPKIANVVKNERRRIVLSVLTNNRKLFKCGREIKKRTTIWGLRARLPPPVPSVFLSFNGRITDQNLAEMCQANRRIKFLPPSPSAASSAKIIPTDKQMRNLMMGVAYQRQTSKLSDTESPCPSPKRSEPTPIVDDDVLDNTSELNTPLDTSGDETSSKSTLDLIIPPLKDFEGKNNPFAALLTKKNGKYENVRQKSKRRSNDMVVLPITAVKLGLAPMRLKKRQLNEKELSIGNNGEVKRKKNRMGRYSNGNVGMVTTTASKTAMIVPIKADSDDWRPQSNVAEVNDFDYAFNGRRLRQRTGKNEGAPKRPYARCRALQSRNFPI